MPSANLTDVDVTARDARLERMAQAAALAMTGNPAAWEMAPERSRCIFRRIALAVHVADRLDGP